MNEDLDRVFAEPQIIAAGVLAIVVGLLVAAVRYATTGRTRPDGFRMLRQDLGRGILLSELRKPTPWNTYLIDGLPPTPIANPGEEAIKAVLNPPRSEYVFFVADGTGGHVFARTYQEHLLNVARWREIERRKAGLAPGQGAPESSPAPMTDEAAPAIAIPPGAKVIRVPTEAER